MPATATAAPATATATATTATAAAMPATATATATAAPATIPRQLQSRRPQLQARQQLDPPSRYISDRDGNASDTMTASPATATQQRQRLFFQQCPGHHGSYIHITGTARTATHKAATAVNGADIPETKTGYPDFYHTAYHCRNPKIGCSPTIRATPSYTRQWPHTLQLHHSSRSCIPLCPASSAPSHNYGNCQARGTPLTGTSQVHQPDQALPYTHEYHTASRQQYSTDTAWHRR